MGWLKWAGRTRSDSAREISNTEMTTMGMFRKNFPETPGMNKSGAKKTHVVRIENTTGTETDLAPTTAARRRDLPDCRIW